MTNQEQARQVRELAKELARRHPGRSIELRIPPWVAVQVGLGAGSTHTRGTPSNVVEMDPDTFLGLASGELAWDQANPARLRASGAHAQEIRQAFPL